MYHVQQSNEAKRLSDDREDRAEKCRVAHLMESLRTPA